MRPLGPPAAGPPPRGAGGGGGVSVSAARDLAPPGWDDEVRRAGGTTFHSAAFGRAAAAAGREAWYLRICRDHRGAGYAVGAGSRSRWPVLGPRRSVLAFETLPLLTPGGGVPLADRKSTRLNSSHGYISYAVFCLKKKKKKNSSC